MKNESTYLLDIARPIIKHIITKIIESSQLLQTNIAMQLCLEQFHSKLSHIIAFNLKRHPRYY